VNESDVATDRENYNTHLAHCIAAATALFMHGCLWLSKVLYPLLYTI